MGNERNANAQEKILRAEIESITKTRASLTAIAAAQESRIAAIVEPVGQIQGIVNEAVKTILPLLGPSSRTERLRERSEMIAAKALRIELARSFRNHGLKGIFADLRDNSELSFSTVIGDFLESLSAALSTLLPPGKGRRSFIARTNVNGLHGLMISAGETLVLHVDDPNVSKLISSGALEELSEGVATA
jgi:hypothetical protein